MLENAGWKFPSRRRFSSNETSRRYNRTSIPSLRLTSVQFPVCVLAREITPEIEPEQSYQSLERACRGGRVRRRKTNESNARARIPLFSLFFLRRPASVCATGHSIARNSRSVRYPPPPSKKSARLFLPDPGRRRRIVERATSRGKLARRAGSPRHRRRISWLHRSAAVPRELARILKGREAPVRAFLPFFFLFLFFLSFLSIDSIAMRAKAATIVVLCDRHGG